MLVNKINFRRSKEWKLIPSSEKVKLGLTFEYDGEFWMSFESFLEHFSKLEICNLSPNSLSEGKKWEEHMFEGEWVRYVSAGGCRNFLGEYWLFNSLTFIFNIVIMQLYFFHLHVHFHVRYIPKYVVQHKTIQILLMHRWKGSNNYFFVDTFSYNPQYRVTLECPDEDDNLCTIIVALLQKYRREDTTSGCLSIGFTIYHVRVNTLIIQ